MTALLGHEFVNVNVVDVTQMNSKAHCRGGGYGCAFWRLSGCRHGLVVELH